MNNLKQGLASFVKGRNFSPTVVTAMIIAIFVVANALIYVAYSVLSLGEATVEQEDLSITDSAKPVFEAAAEAGKKLTVTFCMREADIKVHDTGSFVYRTAKEFEKKYPDFVSIEYVNIFTLTYDGTGERFDPAPYQRVERRDGDGNPILDKDGNPVIDEYTFTRASVIFECETFDASGNLLRRNIRVVTGTSAFIDFFTVDDSSYVTSYNGEEMFTSVANWVISDEHKTAYFTMGHGEVPSLHFYKALISAGYYIGEINLRKQSVPEDAALVIISNPKSDFERAAEGSGVISELDRLDDYKERGGSFYVVIDPLARRLPRLEEFVADFGISFRSNDEGERLMVKDLDRAIGIDGFTLVADYADNELAAEMHDTVDEYGGNVIISQVAALDCDSAKGAAPLLVSSPSAVLEASGNTVSEDGSYTLAAYSERYNESGENARMFFVPSVYLTATDAMITNGYSNKDFLYSLFDVFYGADDLPYGTNVVVQASTMLENLTLGTSIIYTAILLALPVVLAAVGLVTIIRRKNR